MYFAVDAASVPDTTAKLVELIQSSPKANWTAVVDRAFDHGHAPYTYPGLSEALYACDELDALAEVSPLLIPLNTRRPESLQSQLWDLVEHCSGRPMLSLVASAKTAKELMSNWQRCVRVVTTDGQKLMLRFTDTRVLPALPEILCKESWAALTHELAAWWYVGRSGSLAQVQPVAADMPPQLPILVDKREFNLLMDWGEPDAVIDAIFTQRPAMLPTTGKAEFFKRIAAVCKFAREKEIEAFPDVVSLGIFDTLVEGKALTNPKLLKLAAERSWQDGQIMEVLTDLIG